jgi:hypothetical protein
MDDTDRIRLATRIKARTRDVDVIKLCDAVLSMGRAVDVTRPAPVDVTRSPVTVYMPRVRCSTE